MNEEFNKSFLSRSKLARIYSTSTAHTKISLQERRWLERLIDDLTFASSVDQAPFSIHEGKVYLLTSQNLATVASSLEDLLFYRLGKEWLKRRSLSMLLEQVQLAQVLGADIHFIRAHHSWCRKHSLF